MIKYVIITTARNEGLYISRTLESVVNQTILPQEWVIINDGSTDNTSEIIAGYANRYPWIIQIDLIDFKPGLKSIGGRVGHILNLAARSLNKDFDIITKLDADTEFDKTFFEQLLAEFEKNKKQGIASGHLVFEGKKEVVDYNDYITRGAVMLIRKEVFKEIKGFFESKGRGEDTLFSVAARYHGWKTGIFPVFFNHLKPEGRRHSIFYESYNTGFYKGSIPYMFFYFITTQLKHIIKKPYVIGTILQITGYVYSRWIIRYKPFPGYIAVQLYKEQKVKLKKKITN